LGQQGPAGNAQPTGCAMHTGSRNCRHHSNAGLGGGVSGRPDKDRSQNSPRATADTCSGLVVANMAAVRAPSTEPAAGAQAEQGASMTAVMSSTWCSSAAHLAPGRTCPAALVEGDHPAEAGEAVKEAAGREYRPLGALASRVGCVSCWLWVCPG